MEKYNIVRANLENSLDRIIKQKVTVYALLGGTKWIKKI